jgi:hypothetical protein
MFSERLAAAAAQIPARALVQWHDKTQSPHALRDACLKAARAKTRPRPRAAPHLHSRLMLVTAELVLRASPCVLLVSRQHAPRHAPAPVISPA